MIDGRVAGKRVREVFASEDSARARMREIAADSRALGEWWISLPAHSRAELAGIAQEAAAAGVSLRAVWDAYRAGRAPETARPRVLLGAAVSECIRAKKEAGRSSSYVAALSGELARFARGAESLPLSDVTPDFCAEHAAAAGAAAHTRATALSRVSTFCAYCVRRGWMEENPVERLERVTVAPKAPRILSAQEARRMLSTVSQECPAAAPWFVLGLFAGLRPSECDRITWDAVDLARGIVTVDAAASKVRRRRVVTLSPQAAAWVTWARSGSLPLPVTTRRRALRAVRDSLGWYAWPADVLRHSAASYAMAETKDAGRVAHSFGNSPGILLRHYLELVSPQELKAWQALLPSTLQGPPPEEAFPESPQ
jgi:integrase